jgi:hypothetical protein
MLKEFTIKRSEWQRGKGGKNTQLLGRDDMKCCLGFFALACGVEEDAILDQGEPAEINIDRIGLYVENAPWLLGLEMDPDDDEYYLDEEGTPELVNKSPSIVVQSEDCGTLIRLNDAESITDDSIREKKISDVFEKNGVKVDFIE